jgi:hypothetical protein
MKLELKHLAPYLPYGLKMINEKSGSIIEIQGAYENTESADIVIMSKNGCNSHSLSIWPFKPILRPLSDLTDKSFIEHLTRKAINQIWGYASESDFDVLEDVHYYDEGNGYGIKCICEGWIIGFTVEFNRQKDFFLTIRNNEEQEGRYLILDKLELFNWLFSHHFDIFGLIDAGLAIDINTINKIEI